MCLLEGDLRQHRTSRDGKALQVGPPWGLGPQCASESHRALHPAGQPAFLLGTFLLSQFLYFYPNSNNQVLEKLSEESTRFFLF